MSKLNKLKSSGIASEQISPAKLNFNLDKGFIYAPYVPLQVTPIILPEIK